MGNKNAVTTGLYEKIILERLSDSEKEIFNAVSAEESLGHELKILRFKLLRLLDPVEREVLANVMMQNDEGKSVLVNTIKTLKVDEATKAFAIEKLVDGIRKISKEMQGSADDDPLIEFINLLGKARKERRERGEDDETFTVE